MYTLILSYSLRSFMVVEITRVLKRPNRTKNYVRHLVVGYVKGLLPTTATTKLTIYKQ
jgi:hypothetical protein